MDCAVEALVGVGTWLVHVDPGSTFHLNSILETKYSLGIVNFVFLHLCTSGQASTTLLKCLTVDLPPGVRRISQST